MFLQIEREPLPGQRESWMWAPHLTGGSINTLQTETKTRSVYDSSANAVSIQIQLQCINTLSFSQPKIKVTHNYRGFLYRHFNRLVWKCVISMHFVLHVVLSVSYWYNCVLSAHCPSHVHIPCFTLLLITHWANPSTPLKIELQSSKRNLLCHRLFKRNV